MKPIERVAQTSTATILIVGLLGLASGMGIGRFAMTPLLPLMLRGGTVSLRDGAWMAAANYAGYLLGAVVYTIRPAPAARAAQLGLVVVAALTLAMAAPLPGTVMLLLRLATGCASAFVLVGISGWALPALEARNRGSWSGWVFAGVGSGMAIAGIVALVAGFSDASAAHAWLALGLLALAVLAVAWSPLTHHSGPSPTSPRNEGALLPPRAGILIACYGAFGLGYIIPATFLPAIARRLLDDPAVFGWVWPIFGAAAAISTVLVARAFRGVSPVKVWAFSHFVMAAGVVLPVVSLSLASICASALCVGGTFMVATMSGLQAARAAARGAAPRLMAAMTGAFACGQLLGPVAVAVFSDPVQALAVPSLASAFLLVLSAAMLLREARLQ